jgi:hypothetical protein
MSATLVVLLMTMLHAYVLRRAWCCMRTPPADAGAAGAPGSERVVGAAPLHGLQRYDLTANPEYRHHVPAVFEDVRELQVCPLFSNWSSSSTRSTYVTLA